MLVLWYDINKNKFSYESMKCIEKMVGISERNYICNIDQIRHLVGIILAEYGWCWITNNAPIEIIEEKGKPFFSGLFVEHNIQFNISHSGAIVICAIGKTDMGIDIEEVREEHKGIADNFYTEFEITFCEENEKGFYKIWTRKESYLKALGKGITELRNTPSMVLEGKLVNEVGEFEFQELDIKKKYEVVLCSLRRNEELIVMEVDDVCMNSFLESNKG